MSPAALCAALGLLAAPPARAQKAPPPAVHISSPTLVAAPSAAKDPYGAKPTGGTAVPVKPGEDPKQKEKTAEKKSRRDNPLPGLRFFGLDLGSGFDARDDARDPYMSKGIDRVLDWDVRALVALDGLGATFRYRHPQHIQGFTFSYKQYWDWPGALAGGARDSLYKSLGSDPQKNKRYMDVAAAGNVNPEWGFNAEFNMQKWDEPGGTQFDRTSRLGAGYSPLGDNPGKPWNFTVLLSANEEALHWDLPGVQTQREGFGGSTGLAFQYALSGVPIPLLNSPTAKSLIWLDRFKASITFDASQVWSFSVNPSAGVNAYVTKYLSVFLGANAKITPAPHYPGEQKFGAGPNVGLDLHGF